MNIFAEHTFCFMLEYKQAIQSLHGTFFCGRCSMNTWWQEMITTLVTGSLLVVFRVWLEIKWKDK